jgi:hypothetical protein
VNSLINFTGEKAVWRGISKADRDAVKSVIKKELIEKKILELQSLEESDFQITIELYEKYDNMCRENKYVGCIVWGDWLEKKRNTNRRQLQLFEESKKEREILSANKSARKRSVVRTFLSSSSSSLRFLLLYFNYYYNLNLCIS